MRILATVVFSCMLFNAITPGYADDSMTLEDLMNSDSECKLFSKNCVKRGDKIEQNIKALDLEIQKGTKDYKPEDIEKLREKLEEINRMLDNLSRP